jgi:hypothetical protein
MPKTATESGKAINANWMAAAALLSRRNARAKSRIRWRME